MKAIITLGAAALMLAACAATDANTETDTVATDAQTETEARLAEVAANDQMVITEAIYPFPAKQPNFGPRYGSIKFTDTDPGPTIGGTLTMGRAVDENGDGIHEGPEGISMYMVHWGLEVGAPGTADDKGAGDHGGDCRGFRDTGHVVMKRAEGLGTMDNISWEIPHGTVVPDGAVYFVGHTLYGEVHNLGKCTQTPINNLIE